MTSGEYSGELHVNYGQLSNQEYCREFGYDMQFKPVLDAKIQKLVQLIKPDDDVDYVSAWVKYDFWEGRIWVSLGT